MDTMRGFLIVAIIGIALTPLCSNCQTSYKVYLLREKLETALLDSSENKYELNQIFPLGGEPRLIQCVPVKYFLTCGAQHSSSEGPSQIDCTKGYNVSFLWTSFDVESFQGQMLLRWAIDGVHIMGFNWAEECALDFDTAPIFHLDVSELCPSTPMSEVDQALVSLTEMLPTVNTKEYPTLLVKKLKHTGFTSKWKDASSLSIGEMFFSGAAMVVVLTCLLIAISVGPRLYKKIYTAINDEKSQIYLYFWACEIVVVFWCWIFGPIRLFLTPFFRLEMLMNLYIYLAMMLMLPLASWVVIDRLKRRRIDHLIPVPFVCKHGQDCCLQWQRLSKSFRMTIFVINIFAVWNLFACLIYFLRVVPSVMLSYYVFPQRTLMRVSFYQFTVVLVVFAVASFLYNVEKLWWLKKSRELEKELVALQGPSGEKYEEKKGSDETDHPESPGIMTILTAYRSPHLAPSGPSDHNLITKPIKTKIVHATTRVIAGFTFLSGSIIVCGIIGVVVFEASRDESTDPNVGKFLTVVPTFVLNAALWMLNKDHILAPRELKALGMASVKNMKLVMPKKEKEIEKEKEGEKEREGDGGGKEGDGGDTVDPHDGGVH